jgi:hypothetical protein
MSTRLEQILDLFAEDSWRNVYAVKSKVRPPGAPTTRKDSPEIVGRTEPSLNTGRLLVNDNNVSPSRSTSPALRIHSGRPV